jgi:predicted nucleic acid-binding Zn ribbon protein
MGSESLKKRILHCECVNIMKGRSISENGEFSRLKPFKKCPLCGNEMEKGYLNAPRGAYWSAERQTLGLILMDSVMPGELWSQDTLPAVKCKNCGIVLVDLKAPGYTPKSFLKKCVACGKEIPIASEERQYCGESQIKK